MEEKVKVHDRNFNILIERKKIADRIRELGGEVAAYYRKKKKPPIIIGVLQGGVIFTSDLVREISIPLEMDFVRLKSYSGMKSTGQVIMTQKWEKEVRGKCVLITEDIIDSGASISFLKAELMAAGAEEVKIATLLFKPNAFQHKYDIDWVGFNISDEFVLGLGLDYDGLGRNLPHIYQLSSR